MDLRTGFCGLVMWLLSAAAGAQTLTTSITYPPEIDKRRTFAPLDESLFGDRIQLQDGAVVFTQTDVTVPTNSGMRLAIGRRTPVGRADNRGTVPDIFGDWDPDIPMMKGTYDARDGWNAGTLDGKRCSTGAFVPKAEPPLTSNLGSSPLYQSMYWHGVQIVIPQQGTETALKPNAGQVMPTDGATYVGTTKSQWRVSCLSAIKNGSGEGFVVRLPDGNAYQFDWMVTRQVPPLIAITAPSPNVLANLQEVYLYATKVTDRHGNTINYQYDPSNPSHLLSVTSSDGGAISLDYANGLVSTVSVGSRQWSYGYSGSGNAAALTSVTLPDSTAWTFTGAQSSGTNLWGPMVGYWNSACQQTGGSGSESNGYGTTPIGQSTLVMRHPSGATGTFTLYLVHHGTTNTPGACFFSAGSATVWGIPSVYVANSLAEKTIQGPGLPIRDWRYTYSSSWSFSCGNCNTSTSTTTVLRNDGVSHTYNYGNNYQLNMGQLMSETISGAGTSLSRTYTYLPSASGQPFPDNLGDIALGLYGTSAPNYPQAYGNPFDNLHRPLSAVTTTVDGATLTRANNTFDQFARPLTATDSNASYSRTRATSYFDDRSHWVMGQVASNSVNSVEVGRIGYDSMARPQTKYQFGKLVETLGYGADGTLTSAADGSGATVTYGNWKRGIPQSIRHPITPESPQGALESAVVDDSGWVTSVVDAAGNQTCYSYDLMGRVNKIVYPLMTNGANCDAAQTYLNQTTITSGVSNATEYGIPPGHWKQATQTGQGVQNIYFDAYWRPIVSEHYDATNAGATRSIKVTRYDLSESPSFESYPMSSLTDWSTANVGRRMYYDGLARLVRVEADTELGVETTTNTFGAMSVSTKNARGFTTTTNYQMFDSPEYTRPMLVSLPQTVSLSFVRDAVGLTTSLTRSGGFMGGNLGATRSYVYDANEQLCKIIEPEIGATLMDWDAAGNRAWVSGGTNLTSNSCDRDSVTAAQKISFGYDARRRLTNVAYGDGSPGTTRTYKPDGLPATISSDGSVWSYEYNVLRKLTSETMTFGGVNYALSWSYDGNGNQSQVTYPAPGNKVVNFAPNALGQPTKLQGYASSVAFYPNGAVSGFVYGNGISRTVGQNSRLLTSAIVDTGILSDAYSYDAVGNVVQIKDNLTGATTRTMGYDDLDRLMTANGPWGTGSFTYDPLNNLRSYVLGSRSVTYSYDNTRNRLASVTVPPTGLVYGYDSNGNVTSRTGYRFVYDLGNRLRNIAGIATYQYDGLGRRTFVSNADGSTMLQMYDSTGRLMYAANGSHNTAYIYLGHTAIAEDDSLNGVTYLHTDAIGTPVARSTSSGAPLSVTRMTPFGGIYSGFTPTAPDSIGFTGHINDAAATLVYMQQRYYDSFTGRFMSLDPVATDQETGRMFDRYTYAQNNPYRFVDPDGRESVGEMIEQRAMNAALAGDGGATYGWAFAGAAWGLFGAEGVSQVADKGSGASGMAKTSAAVEVAVAVLPGVKAVGTLAKEALAASKPIALGEQIFSSATQIGGAAAEQVIKRGTTLTFENFTIQSVNGGRDLLGPMRQLLQFAKDNGATKLVFEGTFSNPELAAKFGKQAGDDFKFVVGADKESIMTFLKGF